MDCLKVVKIDYLGKPCQKLLTKKAILFDMDGTIYNENNLFPNVIEFLDNLNKKQIQYFFITNNSSKSTDEYLSKLYKMGIEATRKQIITSTRVAIDYLLTNHPNQKTYVVGTKAMKEELKTNGILIVENVDDKPLVVLVGNDTELTFDKLRDACYLLTKGATFIATNIDEICPVSFGYVPDCGAICHMLTLATGKKPLFLGKPKSDIIDYVIKSNNLKKEDAVFIGDRLYTDMEMANKAKITSICVLSGEASIEDVHKYKGHIDYVFEDISSINRTLFNRIKR
jgi:4-nitrophenyl phosphatase